MTKNKNDINLLLGDVCGSDMLTALHKTIAHNTDPCENRVNYIKQQINNKIIPCVALHGKRIPIEAIICIDGKPASVVKSHRTGTWVVYDTSRAFDRSIELVQIEIGIEFDVKSDIIDAIDFGILPKSTKIMYVCK